tara:strand:- start:11025 stop:11423 length:399 start_codon:yes stop_codon:yes gene_type:complete
MSNYKTIQLEGAAKDAYIAARYITPAPVPNHGSITKTIDKYDFRQAFHDYGRGAQFSYNALTALFEWLEELSTDAGAPYELDVIALCCEFSEYSDLAEIQADYSGSDIDNIDDLHDLTHVIEFDGGLIIQQF